jgi:hypothetical protein
MRRHSPNLRDRFRHLWQLDPRELSSVLHWQHPGTVWAMDHAEPHRPIDGRWPRILAVRDLASGYQVAWLPVLVKKGVRESAGQNRHGVADERAAR